jgi:DNA-binding response OmpR family regulator
MPSRIEPAMTAFVVEDEALIALAVHDLLEAEGFETVVAFTEAEARSLIPTGLSVAIVSLVLDGKLTGKSTIQDLRSRIPNLPIVVMTAYEPTAPEADLRGLGGPTVRFHKPASFSSLATAVWEVIEAGRQGPRPHPQRRRDDHA